MGTKQSKFCSACSNGTKKSKRVICKHCGGKDWIDRNDFINKKNNPNQSEVNKGAPKQDHKDEIKGEVPSVNVKYLASKYENNHKDSNDINKKKQPNALRGSEIVLNNGHNQQRKSVIDENVIHGGSVADKMKNFETKNRSQSPVPPSQRRRSSTASQIANTSNSTKCNLCGQLVYNTELKKIGDIGYHIACFKCGICSRKITDTRFGMVDDIPYCYEPGRDCYIRKDLERKGYDFDDVVQGTTAGVRQVPSQSIDVSNVIETMGPALERAIQSNIPRCEICGSTFQATDQMYQVDYRKWHKECRDTGKPQRKADLNITQAAFYVQELITMKLKFGEKIMTFFFIKNISNDDIPTNQNIIEIPFIPDPNSHQPNSRKHPELSIDLPISVEGTSQFNDFIPISTNLQQDVANPGNYSICGFFSHNRFQLQHELYVNFHFNVFTQTVTSLGALVKIQK